MAKKKKVIYYHEDAVNGDPEGGKVLDSKIKQYEREEARKEFDRKEAQKNTKIEKPKKG